MVRARFDEAHNLAAVWRSLQVLRLRRRMISDAHGGSSCRASSVPAVGAAQLSCDGLFDEPIGHGGRQ